MSAVPPDALKALAGLGIVSRETLAALVAYVALLEKWQAKINLISKASLPDVWMRHVVDSAQLWPLVPEDATTLTDLGSGAGFPGLVLAVLGEDRPGFQVHLIESDTRKCAFLREVIRATGAPATVHNARAGSLDPWPSDVVTARALAPLPDLLPLANPFVAPDGIALFLKGRGAKEELTSAASWGTFTVEALPSHTAGEAQILKLSDLRPA